MTRASRAIAAAICVAVALAPGGPSATADTTTPGATGQTSAPPSDPGAGGAVPVVPVHGGCIIGLNCGCIRGTTGPCSGPPLLKHPAIHDAPQNARTGAADGHP